MDAQAQKGQAQGQATQKPATEKAPRKPREKDTSMAGRLIDRAREFRKAFRAMGGARPEKIEEARKEAADLRKEVASLVNDPEAMNDAIKKMRKAEGRIDRMLNKDGNKRTEAIDTLKQMREDIDSYIRELEDE